jgi:hypothetical protein
MPLEIVEFVAVVVYPLALVPMVIVLPLDRLKLLAVCSCANVPYVAKSEK